jgi:hypothetical protein
LNGPTKNTPFALVTKTKKWCMGFNMIYIEFGKPTRFCSMTFLVRKIELDGVVGSLQATFGSAKG